MAAVMLRGGVVRIVAGETGDAAFAEAGAERESIALHPGHLDCRGGRGQSGRSLPAVAATAQLDRHALAHLGEARDVRVPLAALDRIHVLPAGAVTCLAPDTNEGVVQIHLPTRADNRRRVACEATGIRLPNPVLAEKGVDLVVSAEAGRIVPPIYPAVVAEP